MTHSKYIVIRTDAGVELLFHFPQVVKHTWMLEAAHQLKADIKNGFTRPYLDAKCIGAGFVMEGQCYGRSESLNIGSRGAVDTALLARGGMS